MSLPLCSQLTSLKPKVPPHSLGHRSATCHSRLNVGVGGGTIDRMWWPCSGCAEKVRAESEWHHATIIRSPQEEVPSMAPGGTGSVSENVAEGGKKMIREGIKMWK